jgi:hypothetical protein
MSGHSSRVWQSAAAVKYDCPCQPVLLELHAPMTRKQHAKMKKKEKKLEISDITTLCCNAGWYIRSRANYRCEKCNDDVTLQIVFAGMTVNEPEKK